MSRPITAFLSKNAYGFTGLAVLALGIAFAGQTNRFASPNPPEARVEAAARANTGLTEVGGPPAAGRSYHVRPGERSGGGI